MTTKQAFDKRIKRFLKEQPTSTASRIIRKIENQNPNHDSYYSLFDNFSFEIGLGIIAKEVVNRKTDKTIGYIPFLKYYSDNILNEKPRVVSLTSCSSPLSLNQCYDYLAKELLYRIIRIENLDTIITEKNTKL